MSDSPPEKDVQWSEQGMTASFKFVQKFWELHKKIKLQIIEKKESDLLKEDISIEEFTNQTINKININLEKFSYNVIVANLHEVYNFFNKIIEKEEVSKNLRKNYIKILKIMLPIVPHFASECLEDIGAEKNISWPEMEEKYLSKNTATIVVQINGKKRAIIDSKINITEEELIKIIKQKKELEKFIANKNIFKSIYIKDKLINLILR